MPKTYGVKEKDKAAEHIVDRLLTGRLHSGDRVDRNEIAATLGMSRVPVQEAIVQLECDGILSSRYHRGVFVEDFDADVVREHHEVYGMLCGQVSARASANPTPRVQKALKELIARLRRDTDPAEFEETVWEFRRTLNHEYAGPRLRAGIRSFQSFMPKVFWVASEDNRKVMLSFYEKEYAAIRRGEPEAARAACLGRSMMMAEVVIRELQRLGVLDSEPGEIDDADRVPLDESGVATLPLSPAIAARDRRRKESRAGSVAG